MSERKTQPDQSDKPRPEFDQRWHLAQEPGEIEFTELEFALMRTYEGFARWQSECLASVMDLAASGAENAMLHIIRMNDRPKTIKDLARLTNRDDVPNIQYSLRKLIAAKLVMRKGSGRAGVTYEVTEEGRRVTDDYAALRQRLLIEAIDSVPNIHERLREATRTLNLLCGIYEEVARVAATHRRS
ncbi:MAG: putative transcription regulator, contains HTH domain (MarR family) [Rhodobacteraceae bacterium HLUCCA12]|nr:MAG: putative transcription regulator, contains HTH domain (MarR family) [Rhodobacteraceae bacterium HLUCCA12]